MDVLLLQALMMLIAVGVHCETQGCSSHPVMTLELIKSEPRPVLRCSFCHPDFLQPSRFFNIIWTLNSTMITKQLHVDEELDVLRFTFHWRYGVWTCGLENHPNISAEYQLRPNTANKPRGCPPRPALSLDLVEGDAGAELLCSFCNGDFVKPKRNIKFTWTLNGASIKHHETARRAVNLTDPRSYGLWRCTLQGYPNIRARYHLRPYTPVTSGETDEDADAPFPPRILVTIITVLVLILLLSVILGTAIACYMMAQYRKTPAHRPETQEIRSSKASLKDDLPTETCKQDITTDEEDNVSYVELQLEAKPRSRNHNYRSTVYASIV